MQGLFDSAHISLAISIASASMAIVSLAFAVYSWRQANRPLVSVRISTFSYGGTSTTLNIIVENSGNRPAKNIVLSAKRSDVIAAVQGGAEVPHAANRCFYSDVFIPVLLNGASTSNGFGKLGGSPGDWRAGAIVPVRVTYGDLGRRRFSTKLKLLLASDTGFAQSFWRKVT